MRNIWTCLALCGLCIGLSTGPVSAQKKPLPRQDEQRENAAVKEAQRDLQEARDKLRDAEKSLTQEQVQLRQANAAQKTATSAVQKVQDRLEEQHGERTGLVPARQKLKDVQIELDRASKSVLDRVHTEQKPLVEALDRAKQALKPSDDEIPQSRREAVAEHAKLSKQLRDAERQALEADATTKPLLQRVDAAESAVQAAVRKFEIAVERDGDLKAARQAFEKSKRDVDAAETSLTRSSRTVAEARNRLAQATQKLQQKQAADARDNNQPRKKSNKGK